VQANAIPENDIAGIGRDNPTNISLYTHSWAGDANYKGYMTTFVYGLSDNISLQLIFQEVHRRICPHWWKVSIIRAQLSMIYSF